MAVRLRLLNLLQYFIGVDIYNLYMNKIKLCIKVVILFFLTLLLISISSCNVSFLPADYFRITHHSDPVDGGWLPNLTGLPDKDEIDFLTKHVVQVMNDDKDRKCTSIHPHLRMMVFQHFVIYQQMANKQHIYFDKSMAHKWAHVLAIILKESSGDSTNITDMKGNSISTYGVKTNLQYWNQILTLSRKSRIPLNNQTNFGLTQTSADRLFNAFHLTQIQKYHISFLEGKQSSLRPKKGGLNTAIIIRRLIWLYQDVAQGRISQADNRIHQHEINQPEFYERYRNGLKMAILYCGTRFMFSDEDDSKIWDKENSKLEKVMASIAYCKLGNSKAGYGMNENNEMCFAKWVTLCPAVNIDIAALTPLKYFATRNATPLCESTFNRLLNQKPTNEP